jgi:ribosomal protein S21
VLPVDDFKLGRIHVDVRKMDNPDAQLVALDKALKIFKRKVEKDGVLFAIKDRKNYKKPSAVEHEKIQRILRHKELERRRDKK